MFNPLEELHLVKGIDPVADALAGTVNSDIFKVDGAGAFFIIYKGAGATGTSVITVEACDDVTPSNSTAVAFLYRACTSGDTWGDVTAATSAGFTLTAGASQLYMIQVPAANVGAEGYGYVRLHAVESANDPVLGGVLGGIYGLRHAPQPDTTIT